jgi:hypothetical protein
VAYTGGNISVAYKSQKYLHRVCSRIRTICRHPIIYRRRCPENIFLLGAAQQWYRSSRERDRIRAFFPRFYSRSVAYLQSPCTEQSRLLEWESNLRCNIHVIPQSAVPDSPRGRGLVVGRKRLRHPTTVTLLQG